MKRVYCPECNEWVGYHIRTNIINEYRGKNVNVTENIACCEKCGNEIFVEEIEEENLKRLYDKYREVAGIIGPEEIINLRKKYGLSQRELGNLLGWGKMTINRYEEGSLPNRSHSDLLKLLYDNEEVLKKKAEEAYNAKRITEKTYKKLQRKFDISLNDIRRKMIDSMLSHEEDIFNGYKRFDFDKLENLISYIADKVSNFYQTSLNKYLWYIDFSYFKKYTRSITGLRYIKYEHGPVIEEFAYKDIINYKSDKYFIEEYESNDDSTVVKIKSTKNYDLSIFTKDELDVINKIIDDFKNKSCTMLSDLSHKEQGWIKTQSKELISYDYADCLKII